MSPHSVVRAARSAVAFTLLEVMVTCAVLAAVAALFFQLTEVVNERALRQRTQVELALLTQALESYRRDTGDYPRGSDPLSLSRALLGGGESRSYLDVTQHRVDASDPSPTLKDPWGWPYQYFYLPAAGAPSRFLLYSVGEDGRAAPPAGDGTVDPEHLDNLDNVWPRP